MVVAELLVNVKDADGKPVEGATVTAGALGTKKTDKNGVADYGKVTPGTYDVTAEKSAHAPKRNDTAPKKDEKKAVSVPDGKKTVVDLVQHPQCANVAFFEGSSPRAKYFGFDHKTNIIAAVNGEYWKPVPDKGTLTMPGSKFVRNASRWVSVAIGEETEVEINFDFKGGECIPCIANSKFEVVPATIADVVTTSVTAKKAKFSIRGKAAGEASLKVLCDGKDIGWFHIWCEAKKTLRLDVACIITARAPATAYNMAALRAHFNDIYRQAVLEVDMRDLGNIDLTGNAPLAAIESSGYPATGAVPGQVRHAAALCQQGDGPERAARGGHDIAGGADHRSSGAQRRLPALLVRPDGRLFDPRHRARHRVARGLRLRGGFHHRPELVRARVRA